ncbi:MAG: spore germination protein, partial [Bacillota bacterium]|nr:spore germination protein [Bacillota bacterium]
LIRLASLIISVALPSFYIAVSTFHQEMLPTTLAISIAAGKEGVPFPAFVEALLMELAFEILREAGLRLPRAIGQAVSIVGALVVGQAAVAAGIVSPLMVIIVAMTAITSFAIPSYSTAITMRLLRFPLMALGASLGFFGIMWGATLVLLHLNSLRSFGEPYLSPLAPLHTPGLKDTLVRAPWWAMYLRPRVGYRDPVRQRKGLMPAPPPRQPGPEEQEGKGQKTRGVPVQEKEGPQKKGPAQPPGEKGDRGGPA